MTAPTAIHHSDISDISEISDDEALMLPQDPRSVATARRFVRDRLLGWGLDDLVDDANLVVSELAANAVVHGLSAYTVRAVLGPRSVRVEVEDTGDGVVRPGGWTTTATGGRGLMLVKALSSSWGVQAVPAGKTVWAELAVA